MPHEGLRAVWMPKDEEDEHYYQEEIKMYCGASGYKTVGAI